MAQFFLKKEEGIQAKKYQPWRVFSAQSVNRYLGLLSPGDLPGQHKLVSSYLFKSLLQTRGS